MLATSAIGTLEGYSKLLAEGGHLLPAPPELIREWPLIGQRLHDLWAHANEDVRPLLTGHVEQIASVGRWVGRIAAGVTLEILQFAAAIVIAGVLLVYAETLTGVVRDLADRVADDRGRRFLDITGSTIRNVSQGVIGIALLQSALLGIGMLVAGVPFAGALTFACLVLAIVQVGPNIVMIPVIIWAWFSLPTLTAAVFTAYTAPLLLVDNVLRPIVMARGLQTPMVVILAGVICGTLAGGLDRPVHRAGRARRLLRPRDGLDRGRTAGDQDAVATEPRPRAAGGVRSGHGPLRFVRRSALCREWSGRGVPVPRHPRLSGGVIKPSLPPQCTLNVGARPVDNQDSDDLHAPPFSPMPA